MQSCLTDKQSAKGERQMRKFGIEDDLLGNLELDADSGMICGSLEKAGKPIGIMSNVDLTRQSTIDRAVYTTREIFDKLNVLVDALSLYAGENIPEELKEASGLSSEQIADLLELKIFGSDGTITDKTAYTFYFGNEDLLDDCLVEIKGTLEEGPLSCELS